MHYMLLLGGYIELKVPSTLNWTIGTTAILPFRASFDSNGSPSQSASTRNSLRVDYPQPFTGTGSVTLFEVSPYNYVLYFSPLRRGINGIITIRHSK